MYGFVTNNSSNKIDLLGLNDSLGGFDMYGPTNPPTRSPVVGDHLAGSEGAGGYIDQTDWFSENYKGWKTEAEKRFLAEITAWVEANPTKSPFPGPSTRINIYPGRPATNFSLSSADANEPHGNETDFGDSPQSNWSADKVLGSFSFDYVTPVNISYTGPDSSGYYDYSFSTEMYVEDVLGFQSNDPGNVGDAEKLFPSRRAKRAKWTISSKGRICPKK